MELLEEKQKQTTKKKRNNDPDTDKELLFGK